MCYMIFTQPFTRSLLINLLMALGERGHSGHSGLRSVSWIENETMLTGIFRQVKRSLQNWWDRNPAVHLSNINSWTRVSFLSFFITTPSIAHVILIQPEPSSKYDWILHCSSIYFILHISTWDSLFISELQKIICSLQYSYESKVRKVKFKKLKKIKL